MADTLTEAAYEALAARYSADWLSQPPPDDMYALLRQYLLKGGTTADIGCGNGRDADWLRRSGYPVAGYDASTAMLEEARRLFPDTAFKTARLPRLEEIAETFDNVVCETVIMHLPAPQIPEAVRNLQRIVRPGGVIYLSWRITDGKDARQEDGRLYTAFPEENIRRLFRGWNILHEETVTSASSGKNIRRLIGGKRD